MPVILVVLVIYCIKITITSDEKDDIRNKLSSSEAVFTNENVKSDEQDDIKNKLSSSEAVFTNENVKSDEQAIESETENIADSHNEVETQQVKTKLYRSYIRRITRYITSLLSVAAFIYAVFIFGFATGYQGSTIEDKLGLDRQAVNAEELKDTALWLLGESESALDDITFRYDSSSVMPWSYDEMNDKLNDAYALVSENYDFIPLLRSNIKYILLSEPMTYTHISGVYTFFTGEANLNINFPDYTLPYTAAHELSHQRGIAREDEANFMAFLVCNSSDDPYIRYSGYQNLYEYVVSALYSANSDYYFEVAYSADKRIRSEMFAYSEFFEKYRDNLAADISGAVNNGYLKAQGQQDGSKSYGRVVDLAVAYYKSLDK